MESSCSASGESDQIMTIESGGKTRVLFGQFQNVDIGRLKSLRAKDKSVGLTSVPHLVTVSKGNVTKHYQLSQDYNVYELTGVDPESLTMEIGPSVPEPSQMEEIRETSLLFCLDEKVKVINDVPVDAKIKSFILIDPESGVESHVKAIKIPHGSQPIRVGYQSLMLMWSNTEIYYEVPPDFDLSRMVNLIYDCELPNIAEGNGAEEVQNNTYTVKIYRFNTDRAMDSSPFHGCQKVTLTDSAAGDLTSKLVFQVTDWVNMDRILKLKLWDEWGGEDSTVHLQYKKRVGEGPPDAKRGKGHKIITFVTARVPNSEYDYEVDDTVDIGQITHLVVAEDDDKDGSGGVGDGQFSEDMFPMADMRERDSNQSWFHNVTPLTSQPSSSESSPLPSAMTSHLHSQKKLYDLREAHKQSKVKSNDEDETDKDVRKSPSPAPCPETDKEDDTSTFLVPRPVGRTTGTPESSLDSFQQLQAAARRHRGATHTTPTVTETTITSTPTTSQQAPQSSTSPSTSSSSSTTSSSPTSTVRHVRSTTIGVNYVQAPESDESEVEDVRKVKASDVEDSDFNPRDYQSDFDTDREGQKDDSDDEDDEDDVEEEEPEDNQDNDGDDEGDWDDDEYDDPDQGNEVVDDDEDLDGDGEIQVVQLDDDDSDDADVFKISHYGGKKTLKTSGPCDLLSVFVQDHPGTPEREVHVSSQSQEVSQLNEEPETKKIDLIMEECGFRVTVNKEFDATQLSRVIQMSEGPDESFEILSQVYGTKRTPLDVIDGPVTRHYAVSKDFKLNCLNQLVCRDKRYHILYREEMETRVEDPQLPRAVGMRPPPTSPGRVGGTESSLSMTSSGGSVTYSVDEDLSGRRVSKVKVRDGQGESQEVVVQVRTKYVKDVVEDNGVYKIHTTKDENNPWADSKRTSKREKTITGMLIKVPRGEVEKAMRAHLMKKKKIDDVNQIISVEDKENIFKYIKDKCTNMAKLDVKNNDPENTKPQPKMYLHYHNKRACVLRKTLRNGKFQNNWKPICTYEGCLSTTNTTFSLPRCQAHRGVTKYSVAECILERRDSYLIGIFQFKFSYNEGAGQDEISTFKKMGYNNRRALHEILAEKGKDDRLEVITDDFDTEREADMHNAMKQSATFLAILAGAKLSSAEKAEKKDLFLHNKEINLSYKNEKDMEQYLKDRFGVTIKCSRILSAPASFPTELGAVPVNGKEIDSALGKVYCQWDINVSYTGKTEINDSETASCKSYRSVTTQYALGTGQQVTATLLFTVEIPKLLKSEAIVNFSNYLGHLFQLHHKLSKTNYTCLNKVVSTELLLGKWKLIQKWFRYFFNKEISLGVD